MFVDDLFDKKTLTENRGGGSPWHSEPEQQQMDVNRRGGLERERNAGLDEPDDVASEPVQTRNGVYEYTVPAGQEDIAQELGLQQHRGHWVSRVPVQRANFQFGRPQFHEIPSQGVAEGLLGSDPNRGQKVPNWAKRGIVGKIGRKLDPAWSDVQRTVPQHLLSKQSSVPATNAPATKEMPKVTSVIPTKAIPQSAATKPSQSVTKNVVKTIADKQGVEEGNNPVAKIKAPRAPSSPALAIPKAPAVAETIAQVERMLESVTSKKSAEMVKAYVDQKFTELGLRNTTECRNLMTHVVQESAIRRRQYAKSLAK